MSIAPRTGSFFDPNQDADAKRRRRIAAAALQQSQQGQGTEMVSGMAVKKSPWESLARALQGGIGQYQEAKADQLDAAAAKRRQEMIAQAVSQFGSNPQAGAELLAQDPATAEMALKYQIEAGNTARNQDFQREMQRMTLDALAPQRNLQIEAGQFELEQARQEQARRDRWAAGLTGNQPTTPVIGGNQLNPNIFQKPLNPNIPLGPQMLDQMPQIKGMQGTAPSVSPINMPANPSQMASGVQQMGITPDNIAAVQSAMSPPTGNQDEDAIMQEMMVRDPENYARIMNARAIQQREANAQAGGGGSKVWEDAKNLVLASEVAGNPIDLMTAYSIAKSGLGIGNFMKGNEVSPMAGALEAARARQEAEAAGTAIGRARGEAQALQDKNAINALASEDLLKEAETLLPLATGSLPEAYATGFRSRILGESTSESRANAALKALGGRLTAQMPRMEGPQSNYDVQLYREMAGDLANPELPAEDRMAALSVIRGLNEKYTGVPATASPPTNIQATDGWSIEEVR